MRAAFRLFFCYLLFQVTFVNCWESYELDLFDLVEDVNQNFYEFFGITQQSEQSEIKKAYRKLSLQWHPDRSSDPDAEKKFRQIVGINDILKDEIKRKRYDEILEFGLPDWRQPIYYFRRVRKLSILELVATISIIVTVGHYFVLWAQHFEKKLTLEDRIGDVRKKLEKKQKKKKNCPELDEIDENLQKIYDSLPTPTLKDTLPYRMTKWSFSCIVNLPALIKQLSKKETRVLEVDEDEVDDGKADLNREKNRLCHLELNPKSIEKSDITSPVINYEPKNGSLENKEKVNEQVKKSKEWSDKEKSDLIKAVAKFPAGTPNRWSQISEFIERPQNECIQMEKQIRSNFNSSSHSMLNSASWTQGKTTVLSYKEEPTITTKFDEASSNQTETVVEVWSQEQQLALEKALKEFNKDTPNRWDRIAEKVPNKNKEDCVNRYKDICNALKKKQQQS